MKKLLSLCLALLLAGCSAAPAVPSSASVSVPPVSTPSSSEAAPVSSSSVKSDLADLNEITVDKEDSTVTILFPPGFAKGSTEKDFDIDQYVKENDFTSATLEADGSLRIVMSNATHKKLVQYMMELTAATLEGLTSNPDLPYIKKVSFDNDFSKITVFVEKEGYQSVLDLTPLNIAVNVGYYKLLKGEECPFVVEIVDEETKEVLRSATFPDTE